jgi:hypothetical protein
LRFIRELSEGLISFLYGRSFIPAVDVCEELGLHDGTDPLYGVEVGWEDKLVQTNAS